MEDRFSKAFRLAPVAITISTLANGRFVDVNDQFCRLSGFERDELIGKTALELGLWGGQENRTAIVEALREHGFVAQIETRLHTRTGEVRLGLSSAQILLLEGERHMLAMFHDITEYRQAQVALEQSEERYRELFEGINDAIFVHDLTGQILDVNEVTCARLGYSRAELFNLSVTDLDTSESDEGFASLMEKLVQDGHIAHIEGANLTKDQRVIQVDVSAKLIHYQGQSAVLAVARDVTERRRTEKQLRESEARYRAVVEDQTELICRYTPDGVLTFVNDAYCRHYGQPRDQLIGMNFLPLVHDEDRHRIEENLRSLTAERPVMTSENRTLMADGTIHWHQWTDHAISDEQGQVVEYQSVGKDITELKEMERERLMTALEREKVKILADFIAAASHDFRTPLSVINTSAYLLNRNAQTDYSDRHYNIIQEQTYYIERLVDGLLTMSRLDRGDVFRFAPLDLNELIRQVETHKHPQIEQKSLTFFLELDLALPTIEADEEWIYRCIIQLVNNAIQFTEAGGSITIRTTQTDELVTLEVRDTGIGISEDDLPYIFDRLYRGEEHRPVGGQGLGLSIAKKIIEGHNGTIEVESQPGAGSIFRVQLPITHVDSNEEPWSLH